MLDYAYRITESAMKNSPIGPRRDAAYNAMTAIVALMEITKPSFVQGPVDWHGKPRAALREALLQVQSTTHVLRETRFWKESGATKQTKVAVKALKTAIAAFARPKSRWTQLDLFGAP